MSSSAMIAAALMAPRPAGVAYTRYPLAINSVTDIRKKILDDAEDAVYSALVSYFEAVSGLMLNKTSWATIKLYYSSFFSLKACLLLDAVIPFHCKAYYLCDATDGALKKGGTSSHHWNWSSIQSIRRLNKWCYSDDSRDAYEKLRTIREDSNYRLAFPDPRWQNCHSLIYEAGIPKSFRTYRDDSGFFYTYLPDHLVLAYPTRLLLLAIEDAKRKGVHIGEERRAHAKKIWPLKDKPPSE